MIARIALRLAGALALVAAAPALAQAVKDKPQVTLDPNTSYIIVRTSTDFAFPVTVLRHPEQPDIDDYLARRKAALDKAHAKWVKKHAIWIEDAARWDKQTPPRRYLRPLEPVEPTDQNLAFAPIEAENIGMIGPLNRFSKANDQSLYLWAVRPGRYAFYGTVVPILGGVSSGTCMCMGSIEFEVKPGQIVNAGTMVFNFFAERQRAKAEGREPPHTELDLPDSLNTISWIPPVAGDPVDPRLAGHTIVPAVLHASGRVPNYFGVAIDRLTPVPGVLAYDRDRIIDLKAAPAPAPAAPAAP